MVVLIRMVEAREVRDRAFRVATSLSRAVIWASLRFSSLLQFTSSSPSPSLNITRAGVTLSLLPLAAPWLGSGLSSTSS